MKPIPDQGDFELLSSFLKAPTGFILERRPMTNSLIIIGTATIKTKNRYRTRKAPPPPVPVM